MIGIYLAAIITFQSPRGSSLAEDRVMDGRWRQGCRQVGTQRSISDCIRITFLRFQLQFIGQLHRCSIVDVEKRSGLGDGRDLWGRRGTRVFSLLQSITKVHTECVFVRYQRHIYGGCHWVSTRVRLEVQALFEAIRQQTDRSCVRLWRWCKGERRWNLLIVVVLILFKACAQRFPQRRADCVVHGNFVRRRIIGGCCGWRRLG